MPRHRSHIGANVPRKLQCPGGARPRGSRVHDSAVLLQTDIPSAFALAYSLKRGSRRKPNSAAGTWCHRLPVCAKESVPAAGVFVERNSRGGGREVGSASRSFSRLRHAVHRSAARASSMNRAPPRGCRGPRRISMVNGAAVSPGRSPAARETHSKGGTRSAPGR